MTMTGWGSASQSMAAKSSSEETSTYKAHFTFMRKVLWIS